MSIATGFLAAVRPRRVLTAAGLTAFAIWNVIVLATRRLAGLVMRERSRPWEVGAQHVVPVVDPSPRPSWLGGAG